MAFGASGQGRGTSSRGRGGRGVGCALFTVDDEPKRPLQLLGDPVDKPSAPTGGDSGEVDPLDAYMESLSEDTPKKQAKIAGSFEVKAAWEEFEPEDAVVSYCEAFEQGKVQENSDSDASDAGQEGEEEQEEGERKRKDVAPLPRVDHNEIVYEEVQTNFYKPHSEISKLTPEQVASLRADFGVSATGPQCPSPVVSFGHLGLPSSLMESIRAHRYSKPTPIQSQALPAGLSGRDVIGVAETGSGKTVAYLLPMLVHCAAQPELKKDEGPIGVVLCPTRELAIQVEKETYKFNKLLGLRSTTLAGGLSKKEQFKDIKKGSEIIIANPGRMIDIIKMKGFTLRRCTMIVLDEADRMLHMGFEYQVRSIVQNIRPNRQTLLFSATLPPKIERLASDLLKNPVRIVVGEVGRAAASVKQVVEVLQDEDAKWPWLAQRIEGMLSKGQLLVFVKSKQAVDDMVQKFEDLLQKKSVALHGDMDQGERMKILDSFRARKVEVLVATDLAARGLDVPSIRTVVSYDAPRDIDTHTHRVGRTGRAGAEGEAFTLLVDEKHNRKMAALLFTNLQQAGSPVTAELAALAQKHVPHRAAQMKAQSRGASNEGSSTMDDVNDAMGDESTRPRSRSRSRSRSGSPPLK